MAPRAMLDIDNPLSVGHASEGVAALFSQAIELMDPRRLEEALRLGANPNGLIDDRAPALWIALLSEHSNSLAVSEALLDAGARVELFQKGVYASALEPCCEPGIASPLEKMKAVLARGGDPGFISHNDLGIPHHLCWRQLDQSACPALLEALREAGADMGAATDQGLTPFSVALESANSPAIGYLWGIGERPSDEDWTAIEGYRASEHPGSAFALGATLALALRERDQLRQSATASIAPVANARPRPSL